MKGSVSDICKVAFHSPDLVRRQLLNAKLVRFKWSDFSGKTFVCVSLTRFCSVGCEFCFFKSPPANRTPSIKDMFTLNGIERFVTFCNAINLGYLLVSGGGEPMSNRRAILRIVESVKSDRISIVTSANWASKIDSADSYLADIAQRLNKRTDEVSVTIRISVDKGHTNSTGMEAVENVLKLFIEKYKNNQKMDLQFHSLIGDNTIDLLIEHLREKGYTIERKSVIGDRISDGKTAIKIVPKREELCVNGLKIKVGYAKMFFSNVFVNLNENSDTIKRNIEVYQEDLYKSEDGNSSVVTNDSGNVGLDFWVNHNGNVSTWGNQYLDNLFNLYSDSPSEIIEKTLSDPAALGFIVNGAHYRDSIVSEVNELAVIRSKAVNIRDYAGALMMDEGRTRLFFTIRVLQDFIRNKKYSKENYNNLSKNLKQLLEANLEELKNAYNAESTYTIVNEIIETVDEEKIAATYMYWIKNGHYKLSNEQKERLLNWYQKKFNRSFNASLFSEDSLHECATEIITYMKPGIELFE